LLAGRLSTGRIDPDSPDPVPEWLQIQI